MLKQLGQYNDLSPALLKQLEDKIISFGNEVRYRFDIEKENPDKTFYNGKTIFPGKYTLDPAVFTITDKLEDRAGKSKTKTIALIKKYEDKGSHGLEVEFNKVRISAPARGILRLDLTNEEDKEICMFMELHPKLSGGMFYDTTRIAVVSRIDEELEAEALIKERAEKRKAANAVADMGLKELQSFADAMDWDSTQKESVLRNLAEELAENDPAYFNDLIADKKIEYLALIKQALDRNIISFDPAELKYSYADNKQVITTLSPNGDKTDKEKFAEWLQVGGDRASEVAKKMKSLVAAKKTAAA